LLVAFLIALSFTAYLTFATIRDTFAARKTTAALPEPPAANEPGGGPASGTIIPEDLGEAANDPLQPQGGPTAKAWDGTSRVNVLVMGLDYRDWEDGGDAPRTDTMILLSLDPASRTAGMLSIPRDLWVPIPGYDNNKINMAYRLGELDHVPGGGPELAMKTVEKLLGMDINYYAQIDFNAFVQFIDQIGGVKVDVPYEMDVDPLGDNNTKTLQPGVQVLPGDLALAYARARNTIGSDFDRAERQQQVIMGIRDRILSAEMLGTLIRKSPEIYGTISSGVRTNMTLTQVIRMAWIAQQIPAENIKRGVIGPNQVNFSYSSNGLDILVPIPDEIRLLRDQVFSTTGPPAPAVTEPAADPQNLIEQEGARVSVLNGTASPGLASNTADYLQSEGINVVESGNADESYDKTALIDYTGNPHTNAYLTELLDISPDRIFQRYDVSSGVDVALFLGDDWAENNTLP
jgi:LCP family protein required for cell wall assembly